MKTVARQARHRRVRAVLSGTTDRPRLVVFRGTKSVSAQLVDDQAGRMLLTVTKTGKVSVDEATALGAAVAKQATRQKVSSVVFDRAGYRYHGIVKAIAEGVREGGVKI